MAKRRKKQRRTPGSGYITKTASGKHKACYPKSPGPGYHIRTFGTRPEAEEWLAGLAKAETERYDVSGGRQLLRTWIVTWLALRATEQPPLKAKTLHDYDYKLGFLIALLGDMALADILPDHVDAAMLKIAKALAPTTAGQIRNLAIQVFDEALRRRYVQYNAAALGKPRRRRATVKKVPRRLSAPLAARLLAVTAAHATALAWWLVLCLGLREGEVLGLRRCDLDLDAGTLSVRQQVTGLAGKRHIDTPKSLASVRTLPIPRALLPAFRLLVAERAEAGYLFPGRNGEPMHPTTFLHLLRHKRFKDKPAEGFYLAAGLPDGVTIHHLRHTAGQLLTDAGTPEHIIAAILGHTASTITRHYAPPTVDAMRPYVDDVQRRLAGELEQLKQQA